MRACTPHECVAIHSYTLMSEEFISSCRIPTYEAFLRGSDHRPAYLWERRFLQHLQLGNPSRRWVLNLPTTCLGWRHSWPRSRSGRNPHPSQSDGGAAILLPAYGGSARPVYPAGQREQLRARESRVLAERMERFMRFRDTHPELADRFMDVSLHELVADPWLSSGVCPRDSIYR